MSKVQKKTSKRKLLIPIVLLVFLFSIIKAGITLASVDSFEITSAEVSAKSSTVDVHNFSFEKCKINNDITFHQVGDSITYKIKVKNNDDKSYTIKSVKDDNTNGYISYIYDGCEGTKLNSKEETTIEVTEKYITEGHISNRNQNLSVNITFTLEDENGNVIDTTIPINTSSNPKTGDNVGVYISIASISFIMLLLLSRKNKISVQRAQTSSTKRKSRRTRSNARIYESTIDNDISNVRKKTENHRVKHGGKGFKLFSLFIVCVLLLPTISKAATEYALTITFESKVALKDKLVVSYIVNNRKYEIITPYNTKIEGLNDPEIPGYEFDKWEDKNGNEFNPDTQITDDVTITAKFTPITYTISYDLKEGILEEEKINPTTYTTETADIELNKPTKEGYVFEGWTGTELTDKTENVTIAKGSIGNRKYTANWTKDEYAITYNLNGGTASGNPTTYTIESDEIILNKPTKIGYTFEGWTGTELTDKTKDVTITKGSTGNREYTANWTPIVYTITYRGLTEEEETALNNPTTFTIETESITLNNPQDRKDNDGDITEKFVGWKEDVSVSTNITIPAELENKIYEATWVAVNPNSYTITYDLDGGTVETANRTSFTKFDTFTLNNPTKRGYTFKGWTGSNVTTPQERVTVPTGTRENLNYTANWTENTYTIAYNLDNGTVSPENPTTYTVNSDTITLINPTKTGYTFKGWTGTELTEKTMEVTILTGSIENREYKANFEANTYTIVFDRNTGSGSMANQEATYDKATNLNENVFTKTGYKFAGWNTKADGKGTHLGDRAEVINLSIADGAEVTLYAEWRANNYQVLFNKNDENAMGTMENQTLTYDETKNLTTNAFTKENYTFKNWNTKVDGTGAVYEDRQEVTNLATEEGATVNLYAQWEGNQYRVIFDKNNENATGTMEPQKFSYDVEKVLSANTFSRAGYSFIGWNTKVDGTGIQYGDGDSVKNLSSGADVTLYAQWAPDYLRVMSTTNGETLAAFDNNQGIKKSQVEKVYTLNTLELPSNLQNSVKKQWDVSEKQNGSIIAYALDTDSNSKYEIYIGQNGGVKANPNSNKLFNFYSNATYMDLSNLITDDVTTMIAMFQRCEKLQNIDGEENWKTDNVECLTATFNNCPSLTSLDVSDFNTEKVTDMQQLFNGCSSLTSLDLTEFNTEKVTSMRNMFSGCSSLTNLDVSRFNTKNVTTMKAMFDNCYKITSLDISNFDTRKVTDMSYMFAIGGDAYDSGGRSSLTNIVFGENFKTDNVTTMEAMFQYCSKLTNIDLSDWNTSKVTNMNYMFSECSGLTSLNVSIWNTSNLASCIFMFNKCSKLTNMDLSNWNMSKITNNKAMFQYCTGLKNIVMPNNYTRIDNFTFNHNSAYNQEKFTIPASVKTVAKSHIFYNFGTNNFKKFEVEEGNTALKTIDDILYSYDGTRLMNIPMGKTFENNRFELPEGVTFLNELSFNRNKNIETLVLPNSYEIERFINKNSNSYEFINSGSSLNVAIYLYSSISKYEVKNDNPRYSSYEGCIYSKDGTELIAIPLHYSGTLNIKDGTTTIGKEAIWAGETDAVNHADSITEINIPASVTTIEANQITILNKLAKKGVTINIDSANTAYEMSNNKIVAK
ncbi:MAG: InlB B-repeat-containing protein [Clostridia bacterium]|nr:InlB B-repeat-containing protein [Clostridia bacterium]